MSAPTFRPADARRRGAARRLCRERCIRARFFPHVADPAWFILIDLAANAGRDISVTSACLASFVPDTTALRHIGELVGAGLVFREPDRRDHRRVFLRLTDAAWERLSAFFAEIENPAPTPILPGAAPPEAVATPASGGLVSTRSHEALNA